MWHTILLCALAGVVGANAIPHFVKGMVGEPFPNVWGNGPLRNAVAGVFGLGLAAAIGLWADVPDHAIAGVVSVFTGGLVMAVFHGSDGAFRLNSRLGLPNPRRITDIDVG